MINLKKKKGLNPFIDRILTNPLSFIQSSKIEPVNELESKNLIVLSKKQKLNTTKASPVKIKKEEKKRPKSMAEAVAAYTGRKYGVEDKKRKRVELSDSEDEGEEIVMEQPVEEEQSNVEENEQPQSDDNNDLNKDNDDSDDKSNEEFESANEYQSSSDSDYRSDSKDKSESESVLSEEPEDLQKLKEDLRSDEAEPSPLKTEIHPEEPEETQEIDINNYYQINELPLDRGSNGSKRINKSWRKKNLPKKPIGLLNQGVTCYMNTAIQSMIHIPAITNYLEDITNGKYDDILSPRSVSHVMADLSSRLWNERKKYIHPKKIIGRLEDINCMMSEWQQEDSHEYFMSLMSRLQEDSTPKGVKLNQSIIYDIFGGLLNQIVICESCKHKSITKQEFYDLSLGFRKKKSKYNIEKSVEEFFSKELIKIDKDKSGYYCENCKQNSNAIKSSTIDQSPEILTVHLKRFKFNGSQSLKVKQSIKYSNYLNLSPYSTDNKHQNMYKLISIISHEGRSISSGHYIAHCLQPDNTWATYDDEYINKISEAQALNDPSAYVLIYSKLKPKDLDQPPSSPKKSAKL